MAPHKKGRRAKVYPGSWDELHAQVYYDPDKGVVETIAPYSSKGTVMKDGHLHIPLPTGDTSRGNRHTEYFRADHICWMLVTGDWPTGWMEHIDGLKTDMRLDNLVHCDPAGERWWYGAQAPDLPRTIVMVDAENGKQSPGPITLRVTWGDGAKVIPQVNEAYRTVKHTPLDIDPHEEDDTFQKGEFGIDWGLHDEPDEADSDDP